ncbi:hypothetical protein KRP22_013584 [Phytophthora ramorum]|nr:hypothetical protein KRP22_11240 [Phytophthora ramorum]
MSPSKYWNAHDPSHPQRPAHRRSFGSDGAACPGRSGFRGAVPPPWIEIGSIPVDARLVVWVDSNSELTLDSLPLEVENIRAQGDASTTKVQSRTSSVAMQTPTVKSLPRVRVLSLRSVIPNYRAQGELWKQLFECAKTHNVAIAGPTFAVNFTLDGRQSDVEVEVCLPIGDDAEVSVEAPFSTRDVPAVPRAAVMVYVGPCEGYFSAYQEFFGWIASEKLTSAGPSREVYVKRPSGNSEEDADSVTEIQLPIGEQASS